MIFFFRLDTFDYLQETPFPRTMLWTSVGSTFLGQNCADCLRIKFMFMSDRFFTAVCFLIYFNFVVSWCSRCCVFVTVSFVTY